MKRASIFFGFNLFLMIFYIRPGYAEISQHTGTPPSKTVVDSSGSWVLLLKTGDQIEDKFLEFYDRDNSEIVHRIALRDEFPQLEMLRLNYFWHTNKLSLSQDIQLKRSLFGNVLSSFGEKTRVVAIVDPKMGKIVFSKLYNYGGTHFKIDPTGGYIAIDFNRDIKGNDYYYGFEVFDLESKEVIYSHDYFRSYMFGHSGQNLYFIGEDRKSVFRLELKTRQISRLASLEESVSLYDVSPTNPQKLLLKTGKNRIIIWNDGEEHQGFNVANQGCSTGAFTSDETQIVLDCMSGSYFFDLDQTDPVGKYLLPKSLRGIFIASIFTTLPDNFVHITGSNMDSSKTYNCIWNFKSDKCSQLHVYDRGSSEVDMLGDGAAIYQGSPLLFSAKAKRNSDPDSSEWTWEMDFMQ